MNHSRPRLWSLLRRAVTFRRALRIPDAFLLNLRDHRDGNYIARLRKPERSILLRLNTSDSLCLEKIFIQREYQCPFPITPRLIIDAGANTGLATLYFADAYPDATIVAIEPDESNFSVLKYNCSGMPNVILIQAALWPEKRPIAVHSSPIGKWASWTSDELSESAGTKQVNSVTVPEILQRVGADRIDLFKIDIEGGEKDLFSRNPEQWIQRTGVLVFELHDRFRPGCARAVYSTLCKQPFAQEVRGENIFVQLKPSP